jgi:hypothetical protein
MLSGLEYRDIDLNIYVKKIYEKPDLINQYIQGLLSKNETYRYNCFKVLYLISEKKPEILYSHWDFFVNHLKSQNDYHKMSAVLIITNLISVDTTNRFEKILDIFYENLHSKKTIVPIYIIKSFGKIVNLKPKLEKKITDLLLNIEKIYLGKQIELIKSAAIESFSEFFHKTKNKQKIIIFVKKQLNSESPKTKKTAKEFLSRWGEID